MKDFIVALVLWNFRVSLPSPLHKPFVAR